MPSSPASREWRQITRLLSESDIEKSHNVSLRILEHTGMIIHGAALRQLLGASGVPVDGATGRVKLPREVVEGALRLAPRQFTVYGRNGDDLAFAAGIGYPCTQEGATKVWDYGTATLRTSTLADLTRLVRLADALPELRMVKPVCCAQDIPETEKCLCSAAAVMSNTAKHNLVGPLNLDEAQIWTDLAEIAAEDGNLSQHPTLLLGVASTSPLQLDRDSAQVLVHALRKGLPIGVIPCPIVGVSSPVTLAGTLVLMNAEELGLLTIVQLVREGTPTLIGAATGLFDMRSGVVSFGCPERQLILVANMELLSHYKLPYQISAGPVDAWRPDVQCGVEKMLALMARGPNSGAGGIMFGNLLSGAAVSLEQMVIDAELFRAVQRTFRGFHIDEETIGLEAIERVGPGGDFLTDPHTIHWMRREDRYIPDLVNLTGERGEDMLERAHARVEALLQQHHPSVPEKVLAEIERYVRERSCAPPRRSLRS